MTSTSHWMTGLMIVMSAVAPSRAAPKALVLHPKVQRLAFSHMGPFVRLDDRTILAIDTSRSLTSTDNGESWTSRPLLNDEQKEHFDLKVSNERTLLRTRAGTIVAAFMDSSSANWTWRDELHDAPGATLPTYVMRSQDNGRTWQDIQKLHDDWTGAVRDAIETRTGRIVFTTMKMLHGPGRHAVLTYSSSDDGATWQPSNLIDLGGAGHHAGAMEPTVIALKDNRTWMLIRTNLMEFWSAYSADDGRYWRELKPSGIPASSAPAIVKRLQSGRLCLVWNRPFPEGSDDYVRVGGDGIWSEVPVSNHRGELSIAFSTDEGQSWSSPQVLCRQPDVWLAYPYLFEAAAGELWITSMQGDVRIKVREADFVGAPD